MAGIGDFSGYNRPYGLDPNRETNDLYDTRYQQIYGYHTPVTEEFQGPPLVMDDVSEDGMLLFLRTQLTHAFQYDRSPLSHNTVRKKLGR